MWKDGTPEQLIDACLVDSCKVSEVVTCIQIGLLCVQHHPNDRPNMISVVVMWSSNNVLSQPKVANFLTNNISLIEGEQSRGRQESSINGVTISVLNAR